MAIAIDLTGGLVLLLVGAELLIKGAVSLGSRFRLPPIIIGATVVAFGTSAPELVVSVDAALEGYGGIAIGNVVGSNICNLALILGLVAVLRPATVDAHLIRSGGPIMILASVILVVLLLNGGLSRIDGLILFAGVVGYTAMTLRSGADAEKILEDAPKPMKALAPAILLFVVGLGLLVYGGVLFVRGGADLALALGVAPAVIGLTVMALGTSMPELATSLVGVVRGHGAIATGNIIGSNVFNALAIPGVAAIVTPFTRGGVGLPDLAIMLGISIVTLMFMYTGARLTRLEGAVLLGAYVAYCAWLYAT